ncbi:MAG: hypothetical protein F6K32_08280 [Desertifilum sp. SIO1I2]|nr:hypothetical protein [Desertifilum sp. SIO1I2]
MAGFGDIVKKAFYLGVGIASYAGEKAGENLGELRKQAQKIADEMVARGEITTEEARRLVDEMVNRAQQSVPKSPEETPKPAEPRRIEILDEEEPTTTQESEEKVDTLRDQVAALQEELRRLQRG